MKKLFFTILCLLYVVIAYPQYITLKGKQLYDSTGAPFFVKGVNYAIDIYDPAADTSNLKIRRHHGYYQNDTYPTPTTDSSSAFYFKDITNDFKIIRDSLGCNTIRLEVGLGGLDSCTGTQFLTSIKIGTSGQSVNINSTSLNFLTHIYATMLDSAAAYGIKVVLLLYGANSTCNSNTSLYTNYIAQTANALKTKTALLAYDECNEPEFANGWGSTKADVCYRTTSWYNTFKTYDPNHLVTVGLWEAGFGPDGFIWSSDVYKADLYTFHIYPTEKLHYHTAIAWVDTAWTYNVSTGHWIGTPHDTGFATVVDTNYNYNNVTLYKDKYNTAVRWLYNTTNLPWLIGETSFSASTHPGMVRGQGNYFAKNDGDLNSQTDFMNNALTVTKQAQGMGVLWWDYHDVSWFVPNDPGGTYMGLVDSLGAIKPAGHALKIFDANTVTGPPPAYPSGYQNLDGNGGATITGVVSGVPDALIIGKHLDANPKNGSYAATVATDESGNFTIASLTSKPPLFLPTDINLLEISAVGYDNATCNGYATPGDLYNGKSFTLNKNSSFNVSSTSLHLSADTHYLPFTAHGEYTLQDFYIKASMGGTIHKDTIIASGEIAILPQSTTDSYAEQTAEAAFFISNGFVSTDCSSATWSNSTAERRANADSGKPPVKAGAAQQIAGEAQPTTNAKTIYLSPESFLLQVYPNPANDKVLLQSAKSINFISLCSVYGNTITQLNWQGVQQGQIDVSQLAPGSYMIKILYTDNTITYTQIIKQ